MSVPHFTWDQTTTDDDALDMGAFGEIYSVDINGEDTVVKRIAKEDVNEKEFMNEVTALERFVEGCENELPVVCYKGYAEDDTHYYIFMTNLSDYTNLKEFKYYLEEFQTTPVRKRRALSLIGLKLVQAIEIIHKKGIIHKDIKGGNVMINESASKLFDPSTSYEEFEEEIEKLSILIIDFGISAEAADLETVYKYAGTPFSMAPELFNELSDEQKTAKNAYALDAFSIGAVMFMLVARRRWFSGGVNKGGFYPLEKLSKYKQYMRDLSSRAETSYGMTTTHPTDGYKWIGLLLAVHPDDRVSLMYIERILVKDVQYLSCVMSVAHSEIMTDVEVWSEVETREKLPSDGLL